MKLLVYLFIFSSFFVNITAARGDVSLQRKLLANFIRFNITRNGTELDHSETSSNAGFQALGRRVRVTENNFDFILGRELFSDWMISLSPYIIARLTYGIDSDERVGSDRGTKYEESLQGYGYGAGISLNLNTVINKTRTQFFVSLQQVQQENKYFLRHENTTVEERSRELETVEKVLLTQASFGVRVYNLYNGYTFNIAVHANGFKSDNLSQTASQGASDFSLDEGTIVRKGNTAYSLGFGSTF